MQKKGTYMMETNPSFHLPEELITQILLRLPVNSLIRFKCVCKSWFSLISHDSHFANLHFQITAAKNTPRLLLMSNSLRETLSLDSEAWLDDDSASPSLNLDFLLAQTYFEIKGSCRGFILLHCSSSLYLWNPSTGIHKQIPFSPFGSDPYAEYFYGFGYDQSTNDYLIVSMSVDPSHFEFFSLRANTWKEIEFFHYTNPCEDEPNAGVLYNGAIHWMAYRNDLHKDLILAFDLMERKLFEMDFLDEFRLQLDNCSLWVFGELLSFSSMDYENNRCEIWVMKEYKVLSSWTKTLNLSIDDIPYFSPICCTKSGDIIGTDGGSGLVKHDKKGPLLEHRSYSRGSKLTMYTESLLSLPGDSEQG